MDVNLHEDSAAKRNIVLIGMPGVGKSTIGVVLAKMFGYDFVDADLIIQQQCDKTLQRLIDSLGPSGFIAVENEVLSGMDFSNTVISTGGSAIYSEDAMKHLAEEGDIVYLRASRDELADRLSSFDERGVVVRNSDEIGLDVLLEERIPLYEKYAQITVDIEGLSITDAAHKIKEAVIANTKRQPKPPKTPTRA